MMISKAVKGKGFRGALTYDLNTEKGRVIGGNMAGQTVDELTAEFGQIRKLRPNLQKAVLHVSLSAAPGEKLSDAQWQSIGQKYLDGMGFKNNQYIMTRHEDTAHEHIHILANRITHDGQVVSDSHDYKRQSQIMRQIEKEYGLKTVEPSQETGRKGLRKTEIEKSLRTGEPNMRLILQNLASRAIKKSDGIVEYAKQLKSQGVALIGTFQQGGQKLTGLVYEKDGFRFKGSDLGKSYTPAGLSKKGLVHEQNGKNDLDGYISHRERGRSEFYQRLSTAIDGDHQGDGGRNHSSGSIASEVIAGIGQRKRDLIRASKNFGSTDKTNAMGQPIASKKNHDHNGRDGGSERNNNGLGSLADDSQLTTKSDGGHRYHKIDSKNENTRGATQEEEIKSKSKDIEL
jgi:hypothetical protein